MKILIIIYYSNIKLSLSLLSQSCITNILCHRLITDREWGPSWPWSYGSWIYNYLCNQCLITNREWGRHGHDRMVVRFTTTYVISAYHHWCWEFESRSGQGHSVQHYMTKFVSDLYHVRVILWLGHQNAFCYLRFRK